MPKSIHLLLAATLLTTCLLAHSQTLPATTTSTSQPSSTPTPSSPDLQYLLDQSAKLQDSDIAPRISLAQWAFDHHLLTQAADLTGQVIYRQPSSQSALALLQQIDDARPIPPSPETEQTLKDELSRHYQHDFKTRATRHFLFCYDTDETYTSQRGAVMEKAYMGVQFYFNLKSLRPQPLTQRLVVILFKDRADFVTYARLTNQSDSILGFYTPVTNRSAFFDMFSQASVKSIDAEIASLKTEIDDLNTKIAAAGPAPSDALKSLTDKRSLAGEKRAFLYNRRNKHADWLNDITTMHEAIHQLVFNMGIQTRFVHYPLWFTEGLACSFEIDPLYSRPGPALVAHARLASFQQMIKDNKVVPIEMLIAGDPDNRTGEFLGSIVYPESWAFFFYLYSFHRNGIETYLSEYNALPPQRPIPPEERTSLFTKAFGTNLPKLNQDFLTYIKSLPPEN